MCKVYPRINKSTQKYCVIALRSVFVQGIQALETLSPYIYYELLIKASGKVTRPFPHLFGKE